MRRFVEGMPDGWLTAHTGCRYAASMHSRETDWSSLLSEAMVPGVAGTVIRDGRLDHYVCCGTRRAGARDIVDEHTVFEAASLSKPVFAHLVLQLADQGYLSLDSPLSDYLPDYVPADSRVPSITAKHVLSHSAGFPNWRNADFPLKTYFEPGQRFSYSGEGFVYLQKAVEAITGKTLHLLADRWVLQPLGMTQSSFVWSPRFDTNRAFPHDAFGRPALSYKPGEANAAWCLQTTAADFGRFLAAVLEGARLRPETAALWLRPRIEVRHAGAQCLGASEGDVATGVAWALGWGLEPSQGIFFHWGDNGPSTAFTIGSVERRDALVFFMNGASGLSIMTDLIARYMPGHRPSLVWLDRVGLDAPVRRLLRAALARGIKEVWPEMESAGLGPDELLWIAQGLTAGGREEDSQSLRARISERK